MKLDLEMVILSEDLEMVILSEVGQKEKYRYHRILLIGIIKNDANELIYKIETDSQT